MENMIWKVVYMMTMRTVCCEEILDTPLLNRAKLLSFSLTVVQCLRLLVGN
jgi:hypothetical protein